MEGVFSIVVAEILIVKAMRFTVLFLSKVKEAALRSFDTVIVEVLNGEGKMTTKASPSHTMQHKPLYLTATNTSYLLTAN
jgi:hypothetical protein